MDKKVKTATLSMQIQAPDPQEFRDIRSFVYKHIKPPQKLNTADLNGTIEVGFKVEDDGTFNDFTIIRSITPEIDAEVVRVLKLYPKKAIIKDMQGNPQRVTTTVSIEYPEAT